MFFEWRFHHQLSALWRRGLYRNRPACVQLWLGRGQQRGSFGDDSRGHQGAEMAARPTLEYPGQIS